MCAVIVHGRATSSNVQAVMWGLHEIGVQAERRDVGGRNGGTDDPAFRGISPMGLIPALQTSEGSVFESAAILRYLAEAHEARTLWPSEPMARAQVDQWAEWGKHSFGAAFTVPIFWAHWRTPEAARDHAAIRQSITRFEGLMDIIAPRIEATGFVAGPTLTLADIWVAHVLYRYYTPDIDRRPHPVLADYYARMTTRPGYVQHVMVDYDELRG